MDRTSTIRDYPTRDSDDDGYACGENRRSRSGDCNRRCSRTEPEQKQNLVPGDCIWCLFFSPHPRQSVGEEHTEAERTEETLVRRVSQE